jgi:hypothetical protein
VAPSDALARIAQLKQELASVTHACETTASSPGNLFFLLRRKWKLTQELFQMESELLLRSSDKSPDAVNDRKNPKGIRI